MSCVSLGTVSVNQPDFFSRVASLACASQNYTILSSSLATKKAYLIAQVPVTHLQFPGPLLLLS